MLKMDVDCGFDRVTQRWDEVTTASGPIVETDFPQACGKVVDHVPGRVTMVPDTPANVPGNAQYFFLTCVLPHEDELALRIEWPQGSATDLPGFLYPGNANFAAVLPRVCFSSHDLEHWCRIGTAAGNPSGAEIRLPPSGRVRYVSVGIPYPVSRYERLLRDLRASGACEVAEIGRSRNGRALHGIVFPAPGPRCRGTFILQGYQHHTEWAGLYLLESLARGLADGSVEAGDFAWAIVPCVNVDALYGGWREDLMHIGQGNGKCGNFNRDWADFDYPETRSARDFFRSQAERRPVVHAIDVHMGWSSPGHSGGGLTVFVDGGLPGDVAAREAAFMEAFFAAVPIEPFAWRVSDPERTNFAAWAWREFGVPGQTLEISRFEARGPSGSPEALSQAYYEGLGPAVGRNLVDFFSREAGP
jgi:hypothetical protein